MVEDHPVEGGTVSEVLDAYRASIEDPSWIPVMESCPIAIGMPVS